MSLRETDPTAWLVAHEEIRQLAARYAIALDARDLDTLVGLFVYDVRVGQRQHGPRRPPRQLRRAAPSRSG